MATKNLLTDISFGKSKIIFMSFYYKLKFQSLNGYVILDRYPILNLNSNVSNSTIVENVHISVSLYKLDLTLGTRNFLFAFLLKEQRQSKSKCVSHGEKHYREEDLI